MTINWLHELETTGEGSQNLATSSGARLTWGMQGTNDVSEMYTAVWALVPATYNDGLKVLIFRTLERRQVAHLYWEWTAHYVDPDREKEETPPDNEARWDYDTTGQGLHIYASRETIADYGVDPPDFENSIQVEDNEVKGCQIVAPAMKLTCNYRHPAAINPIDRALEMGDLTGTVNDDVFYGMAAGTVLFLGARGGSSFSAGRNETLEFAYSKNVAGLAIGALAGIDKEGHEFLWINFEPELDNVANRITRRPKHVYIERVYEKIAFADLGIGTS